MNRNRESYLMRFKPDAGRSELFPAVISINHLKRSERSPWASVGDWVGAGLCVGLCFAGITAGVWLVGYIGALGVRAALGL